MSAVDFFDSNILVYLFDDANAAKQAVAQRLIAQALAADSGCISFQVVQETLNVLTQKFTRPVPLAAANEILSYSLLPLWQVQPSAALYTRALEIKERYRFSFYDSLIIAAALAAGCKTLYSEDLRHGQNLEGLTIINPFNG